MNPVDIFELIVNEHYVPLFKFAMSLTRDETDAWDLVQQTFYIWAAKGYQLRDVTKVKTWLFTTLHRSFLKGRRRQSNFPTSDIAEEELSAPAPELVDPAEVSKVLTALAKVDEIFQAPLALFYLEDCSYKDIAAILQVPVGTVKSRIARGIAQLRKSLLQEDPDAFAPEARAPCLHTWA